MKPKDAFVKGPNKDYLMHVSSSNSSKVITMVNPFRIDQKEAIGGSEIGADTVAAAATSGSTSY